MKPITVYTSITELLGINGITLFPFIFLNPKTKSYPKSYQKRLDTHELIHIKQQQKLFVLPFYIIYLYYYAKNLWIFKSKDLAYRNIPFEIEAYQNDNDPNYPPNVTATSFKKFMSYS